MYSLKPTCNIHMPNLLQAWIQTVLQVFCNLIALVCGYIRTSTLEFRNKLAMYSYTDFLAKARSVHAYLKSKVANSMLCIT